MWKERGEGKRLREKKADGTNNCIIKYSILFFNRTALKGTVILLPLMGITWIVGIFAVNQNTLVFAWIFTILNTLQVKS